jgi:hypothetical protein
MSMLDDVGVKASFERFAKSLGIWEHRHGEASTMQLHHATLEAETGAEAQPIGFCSFSKIGSFHSAAGDSASVPGPCRYLVGHVEVLLGHPCAWLHQQLSVELAIAPLGTGSPERFGRTCPR